MAAQRSNTQKFIEKAISKHGNTYDYSCSEYTMAKNKIKIRCKTHGVFEQTANSHLSGVGCNNCGIKIAANKQKKTAKQFITDAIKKNGTEYEYHDITYKNNNTHIIVTCKKHGGFSITPKNHLKGRGCPQCYGNIKKNTTEFIEDAINIHGSSYDYSKTEYINDATPVNIICKKHGIFTQLANNHLSGYGCNSCGAEITSNKLKLSHEEFIKRSIETHGVLYDYSAVKYEKNMVPVTIICKKHGKFIQTPVDHWGGSGCKLCSNSKGELAVFNFIKELGNLEILSNDRVRIKPLEIDIYIPELKLGIEYCGLYWHAESSRRDKYHINNKYNICKNNNIELLTIFENEWINKQEIVKSMLSNKLRVIKDSVFARKCSIIEVNYKTAMEFLNENHIQGNASSSIRIALTFNNTIVAMMTIIKSRYNKNTKYEISRFCSILNTSVVGGASKMFNYFIKTYKPESVISYANLRYGEGDLYKKLGFNFKHQSRPNFHYFKKLKIESRIKYQKHKLIKQGYNPDLSGYEIMLSRGYKRIWDCGNNVWIWNSNN